MSRVSIIMPVYNGIHFIEESIKSIKKQTFTDWEFIIVNEFGSDDGSREVIQKYAKTDNRIKLLQNKERLGLAESLNQGILIAQGEYIARVDVDDPSYPKRLQKQVEYLDTHKDITLCGTIQRSVTPTAKTVQKVSTDVDTLRASMLFGCEISHCSVMFRKEYFLKNNLKYDKNALSEDYDLWMKIIFDTKITNIDEVLVDHRWGFENISIKKGERLREESRKISKKALIKYFNIDIEKEQIDQYLLSGWNSKPIEYAKNHREIFLKDGYRLLSMIEEKNAELSLIHPAALKKVMKRKWDWICECCGAVYNKELNSQKGKSPILQHQPLISVILPVYNSAAYLRLAIDSVLAQSYSNWELLLINEYESDDGSVEICKRYEQEDSRIHFIQNEQKLGLGNSLNKGFLQAKGKYIARLDADDIAHPDRFQKQIRVLEENKDIGICGSWQHHFGNVDWNHKPAENPEQCKANLLFWCDLCHSTLMLRKSVVKKYHLYFNPDYQAEDFELWTRALKVTKIVNIPEVLGEYRCSEENITISKWGELREESGHLVAKQLKDNLSIAIPKEKHYLLNGWGNIYTEVEKNKKEEMLEQLKKILLHIWSKNKKIQFYSESELLTALNSKWRWAKYNEDWHNMRNPYCIQRVFDDHYPLSTKVRIKRFLNENKGINKKVIKCMEHIFKPMTESVIKEIFSAEDKICKHINNITWNRIQFILRKQDARIWKAERETRVNQQLISELLFQTNVRPVDKQEKIRIVFLFQVAFFWPSIESFYESVLKDNRFAVKLLCYDEDYDKTIKTDTTREYLLNKYSDFEIYEKFDIDAFSPHIVVVQTPYDTNRAQRYKTFFLRSKGYRIVYIPYGIEIADTDHAKQAHFNESVIQNCWRLYTLSETMKKDYFKYCTNATAVRAIGLPKFDALYEPEKFPLPDEIRQLSNGRKIILWKVHFPKVISENGKKILVTPYIEEYVSFAKKIQQYGNLFFIFMPHPRFQEFNDDIQVKRKLELLIHILQKADNVYIDNQDDYRYSLCNADSIIIDRSAVMVEAGSRNIPILYMYNPDFNEPLTEAIAPLIESYYQGTTSNDMEEFLDMCQKNEDPLWIKRKKAFAQCIPYFDGKCGERIKEDIIEALEAEKNLIPLEKD